MDKITRLIGSIIVAALLYAVPILATCALIFDWDGGVVFGLLMLAAGELCGLGALICIKAEEGEI